MNDKEYNKYCKRAIMNLNAFRSMNKKEKRADMAYSIFLVVLIIVVPLFLIPILATLDKVALGFIITIISYIIATIVGVLKRKSIFKKFYSIENAENKVKIIENEDLNVFNELAMEPAITFIAKPNFQILNFIYNWLNNLEALKNETLNIYIFTGKELNKKYNYKLKEDITIMCILLKELNITDKINIEFDRQYKIVEKTFYNEMTVANLGVDLIKNIENSKY